jgi:hypothetical protein
MIRSVAITPREIPQFVTNALRDLRFEESAGRFGMFFLHGLDLETGIIDEIMTEDDAQINHAMRSAKCNLKRLPRRGSPPPCSEPSAEFPYGDSPPWKTIVQALQHSPNTLMRTWAWDQSWGNHGVAAYLFILMTVDIWLTVADATIVTLAPHPLTLQEAMQTWTVAALEQVFPNVTFIASNGDVHGGRTGKKQQRFSDMVEIFFPLPGTAFNRKSIWNTLAEKGYIQEYHRIIGPLSPEGRETLHHALRVIFRNLQCLPHAKPCGNGRNLGRIWKARDGMVDIMTNSRFYRLVSIGGNTRKKREHTTRIKASNAVIASRLDQEHRGIPYKKGRKQYMLARKSATSRNYRKPPTKPAKRTSNGEESDTLSENVTDATSPHKKGGKPVHRPRPSTTSKHTRSAPAQPMKQSNVSNNASSEEESCSDSGGLYGGPPHTRSRQYALRPRPSAQSKNIRSAPAKSAMKTNVSNIHASSGAESGSDNGGSYGGPQHTKGRKYALRPRPSAKAKNIRNVPAKPAKKANQVAVNDALSEEDSGSDDGGSSERSGESSGSDDDGYGSSDDDGNGSSCDSSRSCESR